ncbi:MAG: hypothetical protein SGCHY_004555, partial [Lobulomycetales sp.]
MLVIINLTASAFVDRYQLARLPALHAHFANDTSLELPAWSAWPNYNCIYSSDFNLEIPIHWRYHEPNANGSIPIHNNPPTIYTVRRHSSKGNYSSCWVDDVDVITGPTLLQDPIQFTVPVGNPRDRQWVMGVTLGAA